MRSLTRDSFILIASNMFGAVLGFMLSLAIGRGLGEIEFGRWTFCLAWASILTTVCEFGLNSLSIREATQSPSNSNKIWAASTTMQLIAIAIFGSGIWVLSPSLSLDLETSVMLPVAILIGIGGLMYGVFTAVFRSTGWMWPILWINVGGLTIQLVWSLWLISSGASIVHLMSVAVVVDIAQVIVSFIFWMSQIRPGGGPMVISRQDLARMTRLTIPFGISAILGAIQLRSAILMIGYLRSPAEVGLFGVAWRWNNAAMLIPFGVFGALYPAFGTPQGLEHFRRVRPVFQAMSLGLTLILCLLARPLVTLSYGNEYFPAISILFCFGLGLLPSLSNGYIETYLYATQDEKYATQLRVIATIVQISTGLFLVYFFGALGGAVSLGLGELAIWYPLQRRMRAVLFRNRQ